MVPAYRSSFSSRAPKPGQRERCRGVASHRHLYEPVCCRPFQRQPPPRFQAVSETYGKTVFSEATITERASYPQVAEGFQEMGLALEKARKRVQRENTIQPVAATYLEFAASSPALYEVMFSLSLSVLRGDQSPAV
jgi:hypothetical protein